MRPRPPNLTPAKPPSVTRSRWERIGNILVVVAGVLVVVLAYLLLVVGSNMMRSPTPKPIPVRRRYPAGVSQLYWYCWNTGTPRPHHLGAPMSTDHFCTDQELRDNGLAAWIGPADGTPPP
jgi:hypothetical protein